MGRIDYEYEKQQRSRREKNSPEHRKRRLRVFISKMKHDGLIKKSTDNKFIISQKGISKMAKLKNSLPNRYYETTGRNRAVIISFDIPEKLRRKRNWLREVLKNLGFEMIHQSVWVGKVKIPKEFIMDLENLKILEFIEIFEISKTGTLKKFGKAN